VIRSNLEWHVAAACILCSFLDRLEQLKRKKLEEFEACRADARQKGAAAAEQQAQAERESDASDASCQDEDSGGAGSSHDGDGERDDVVVLLTDAVALLRPCCASGWCFLNAHSLVLIKFEPGMFNLRDLAGKFDDLPSSFFAEAGAKQKKSKHFFERKDFPAQLQECFANLMEGITALLPQLLD